MLLFRSTVDPAEYVDINDWSREDIKEFYFAYKQSHVMEWDGQPVTYNEFEEVCMICS